MNLYGDVREKSEAYVEAAARVGARVEAVVPYAEAVGAAAGFPCQLAAVNLFREDLPLLLLHQYSFWVLAKPLQASMDSDDPNEGGRR